MRVLTVYLASWSLLVAAVAAEAVIINIDATQHALLNPMDLTQPNAPGQPAPPLAGTTPLSLNLPAGEYTVTNASGLPGAQYDGWSFFGNNWVWAFAIADASTDLSLVVGSEGFENGNGIYSDVATLAAQPSVQNYTATFTLAAATTLNFGVIDTPLGDNLGGISLNIVPEPGTAMLLLAGATLLARKPRR